MSQLRLVLLGVPRLERDGVPLALETRKALALLAYLVYTGVPHSREHLAALLWPSYERERANANLRRTLSALLKVIGDDLLVINRHSVAVHAEAALETDLQVWLEHSAAVSQHSHTSPTTCPSCWQRLQAAAALHSGPFLNGLYLEDSPTWEGWRVEQAAVLRQALGNVLAQLVQGYADQKNWDLATVQARRWLALEPTNVVVQQRLGELLILARGTVEPVPAKQVSASQPAPVIRRERMPSTLIPLIGREREQAQIVEFLADDSARLLTLRGPGGIGKTRLGMAALEAARGHFRDGVYWVGLAAVTSPDLLPVTILDALGQQFFGRQDPEQQLLGALRGKQLLLLLDNFEQLLAGAELLHLILTEAPTVKLLVTSRERLQLHGEQVLEVEGLSLPPYAAAPDFVSYSAVQLFIDNARRARADWTLRTDDHGAVAGICALVGGMPLAIELAAAWVRSLTCADILHELQQSLDLLTTSLRNVPERHRSLRAVFTHGWQLLSADEQRVLSKLAVFQGPFERDAAAAVAGASPHNLRALIDQSWLQLDRQGRFGLHVLVRQYSGEKLRADAEEYSHTAKAYAQFYARFLAEQAPKLHGPDQHQTVARVADELLNLRSAWQVMSSMGDLNTIVAAATALYRFYDMRGLLHEGEAAFRDAVAALMPSASAMPAASVMLNQPDRRRLVGRLLLQQAALSERLAQYEQAKQLVAQAFAFLAPDPGAADRALGLWCLGSIERMQGAYPVAQSYLQEALELYRTCGDRWGEAQALNLLGSVTYDAAQFAEARQWYGASLAIFEELQAPAGIAQGLNNLGLVAEHFGDYVAAKQFYEATFRYREAQDSRGHAISYSNLGLVERALGDYEAARRLISKAVELFERIGERRAMAFAVNNLGLVARGLGAWDEASRHHQHSLQLFREIGHTWGTALALSDIGYVLLLRGDPHAARPLFSDSLRLFRELGGNWGIAVAQRYLGDVASATGAWAEAEAALRDALQHAQASDAVPVVLEVLVSIARLLSQVGDRDQAAHLLNLAIHHQSCDWETANRARALLVKLPIAVEQPSSPELLADVVQRLLDGESLVNVLQAENDDLHTPLEPLSERERELLRLLAAGLRNNEIADAVMVAPSTIKWHLHNIFRKLDVQSRGQAVQKARELRLV